MNKKLNMIRDKNIIIVIRERYMWSSWPMYIPKRRVDIEPNVYPPKNKLPPTVPSPTGNVACAAQSVINPIKGNIETPTPTIENSINHYCLNSKPSHIKQ